jgi:hypothetical protein
VVLVSGLQPLLGALPLLDRSAPESLPCSALESIRGIPWGIVIWRLEWGGVSGLHPSTPLFVHYRVFLYPAISGVG